MCFEGALETIFLIINQDGTLSLNSKLMTNLQMMYTVLECERIFGKEFQKFEFINNDWKTPQKWGEKNDTFTMTLCTNWKCIFNTKSKRFKGTIVLEKLSIWIEDIVRFSFFTKIILGQRFYSIVKMKSHFKHYVKRKQAEWTTKQKD